ncbi:MAG: hypothetical protein R3E75_12680 [Steroidobacteraceae bacterium]
MVTFSMAWTIDLVMPMTQTPENGRSSSDDHHRTTMPALPRVLVIAQWPIEEARHDARPGSSLAPVITALVARAGEPSKDDLRR